jgi:hypothetical protein
MFSDPITKLKKKLLELNKLSIKCEADAEYLNNYSMGKEYEAVHLIKNGEIEKAKVVARESLEKRKMAENWKAAGMKIQSTVSGLEHMIRMKEYTTTMKKVGEVMNGINKIDNKIESIAKTESIMLDFAVYNNRMEKEFSGNIGEFNLDDKEVNQFIERLCDEHSLTQVNDLPIQSKKKSTLQQSTLLTTILEN